MKDSNNISEFPRSTAASEDVTLDSVIQSLAKWRATKTNPSEQIPDDIWKSIFVLEAKFPNLSLSPILGISKMQFQRKRDESNRPALPMNTAKQPRVDFCEAKAEKTSYYQAAKIPATNTLVVEFCRADGKIMKIHTTTDSFAELMKAFFSGA